VEITKEYKDAKDKFDEIISAVGDYFDLFKQNTKRLEDMWLQILEFFSLKVPRSHTVFR
jgi:uncharacterized protein YaaN involved in tellurite resistance